MAVHRRNLPPLQPLPDGVREAVAHRLEAVAAYYEQHLTMLWGWRTIADELRAEAQAWREEQP